MLLQKRCHQRKFNVTYIFDPNVPWSKLGFFYNFFISIASINLLFDFLTLPRARSFYWNCIGPHIFNCDISLLKSKHFSFSKGIFLKSTFAFRPFCKMNCRYKNRLRIFMTGNLSVIFLHLLTSHGRTAVKHRK